MNKKRIANALDLAMGLYGKDFKPGIIEIYIEEIKLLSEEKQAEFLMKLARGVFKYFPRPAEIPIYAAGFNSVDEVIEEKALEVLAMIKRVGGYESVTFEDPIIGHVIRARFDGWQTLCSSLTTDAEKWFIRDFISAYKALEPTAPIEAIELPGHHVRQNERQGTDERLKFQDMLDMIEQRKNETDGQD